MRVLVLPKDLEIGGSQVTAVDLARGVRRRGVEVLVAAPPGPLLEVLEGSGLPFVPLPGRTTGRGRRLAALVRTIRAHAAEVVHAYEPQAVVDACYATLLTPGARVLGSFSGPRVPWYVPESIPVVVGTSRLFEFTRRWRTARVGLVEPPVDTERDAPGVVPKAASFPGRFLVVAVSRLAVPFKLQGLEDAIRAMGILVSRLPVTLVVVGDGAARPRLEELAREVLGEAGDGVVRFVGEVTDPRRWYEAADGVIGVGAAAVRGMAFAKPTIILGRDGHAEVVAPETAAGLARVGFFGVGDGDRSGRPLAAAIGALAADAVARRELGAFCRGVVVRDYALEAAAERLVDEYRAAVAHGPGRGVAFWEGARVPWRRLHYGYRRARLRRRAVRLGLAGDDADNWVHGRLRELAVPPRRFGTGRYRA